ncbi:sigma 54-interacting transcriptional regulator [uncultured Desulfuromonas sp.]|uniref:sigma-54 interaction domain-containing protein n=1 Tax=uncultured Desulfuromonas sp. TaxID=181013 RepID=UPI002AAAED9C|nr:sigma 54-interacting transcriptional regulator [uncultured Desulfuromonas sp.]
MTLRKQITEILGTQILFANAEKDKLTKKRWQEILRCKEEFLNNPSADPSDYPCMDKDVAASWMRSRKMGVNPHKVVTIPNEDQLTKLREQHQQLIEITCEQIKPCKDQMITCGYMFYLFDKSGMILCHEGVWLEDQVSDSGSRIGILANEESEGTTAHGLCFHLKRPVQLIGPENYCVPLQNRIASAAPIMGDDGEVKAAIVVLSPPLVEDLEDDKINHLYMHTLGLISSVATSIETKIKLVNHNECLEKSLQDATKLNEELKKAKDSMASAHESLTASFAFIDEGMIAVDNKGKIRQINNEAIRIFRAHPEEIGNRNLNEFLSADSSIMHRANKGESFTVDECVKVGTNKARPYRISVRPILNQYTKKLDIVILKFISCEKLNNAQSNRSGRSATYKIEDILGESVAIKSTIAQASRFAASPENILLIGESGTGKELFAHSIHNIYRPNGPFMAVNCAALPRELVGSELFGYEGGSFTGAERCGKPGKIELSDGGTLFLDEIGDMPLEHQAILLRSLQDKRVMRIGGNRYKEVDFRLVAATNKDLQKMVEEKTFREDLYYRISVLGIFIPPLRERGKDISLLTRLFIRNYCQRMGWQEPQLSPETEKIINQYKWPGNVRQLQNAIHHAINTTNNNVIEPSNLPGYVLDDTTSPSSAALPRFVGAGDHNLCIKTIEKEAIEAALLRANNCIPTAAEIVGLSRSTLYRKLKDYNITVN